MLSRVADSLYWMSRYLERAQHTARVVGVNLSFTIERAPDAPSQWPRVMAGLNVAPRTDLDALGTAAHLTFDPEEPASICACVACARENARQVREQVGSEMWEQVNRLYWQVRHAAADPSWKTQPDDFYRSAIEAIYLFEGITDATLARGEGWHYIRLARFLERAAATALLLDVHTRAFPETGSGAVPPDQAIEWVSLLRSCTAFEAYCRRYTATLQPARVAEFLLLDAELPRSVRFAVEQVKASLRMLTHLSGRANAGRPERLAGRLRAQINYAVLDEIDGNLRGFLDDVRRQCATIHAAMYQTFISYQVESALA
jgi:uncharacterized alpha-E superfamily protein